MLREGGSEGDDSADGLGFEILQNGELRVTLKTFPYQIGVEDLAALHVERGQSVQLEENGDGDGGDIEAGVHAQARAVSHLAGLALMDPVVREVAPVEEVAYHLLDVLVANGGVRGEDGEQSLLPVESEHESFPELQEARALDDEGIPGGSESPGRDEERVVAAGFGVVELFLELVAFCAGRVRCVFRGVFLSGGCVVGFFRSVMFFRSFKIFIGARVSFNH